MKFLIDQNRSPRLAELLRADGHDAVHERTPDDELLALAAAEKRVIVSGDTDFGALLALRNRRSPSVVLFRSRHTFNAASQYALINAHLTDIAADLEAGAVVVITDDRIRVRRLPLLHDQE